SATRGGTTSPSSPSFPTSATTNRRVSEYSDSAARRGGQGRVDTPGGLCYSLRPSGITSGAHTHDPDPAQARSSGGERCPDPEEASGSNPLAPTTSIPDRRPGASIPAPAARGRGFVWTGPARFVFGARRGGARRVTPRTWRRWPTQRSG